MATASNKQSIPVTTRPRKGWWHWFGLFGSRPVSRPVRTDGQNRARLNLEALEDRSSGNVELMVGVAAGIGAVAGALAVSAMTRQVETPQVVAPNAERAVAAGPAQATFSIMPNQGELPAEATFSPTGEDVASMTVSPTEERTTTSSADEAGATSGAGAVSTDASTTNATLAGGSGDDGITAGDGITGDNEVSFDDGISSGRQANPTSETPTLFVPPTAPTNAAGSAPGLALGNPQSNPSNASAITFGDAIPTFGDTAPTFGETAPAMDGLDITESTTSTPGMTPSGPMAAPLRTPLMFEQNVGQTDSSVQFMSRGPGYGVYLTSTESVFVLTGGAETSSVVRMQLIGSDANAQASGEGQLEARTNYFLGNDPSAWRTDVANYSGVRFDDVYEGVDLVYYGTADRQLEYDFVVAAGADTGVIRFGIEGAETIGLDADGRLVLQTEAGTLTQQAPVLYQQAADGTRESVSGSFVLASDNTVSFQVGAYDYSRELVIDPVLSYSTYLGGSGTDQGRSISVDGTGNAYVVGTTASTNFPTSTSPYQSSNAGSTDAFVTKYDTAGQVLFSTYFGGSGADTGFRIFVDSNGVAYVTGETASTNLPTTTSTYQSTNAGGVDAYAAKLSSSGGLSWSSYFGGTGNDYGGSITVDSSSNIYLLGETNSTNLPTASAYQTSNAGGLDIFVTKFASGGGSLIYSSYFGGSANDFAGGDIAVNSSNEAWVSGTTSSTNFPTASGYQSSNGGGQDAFVLKVGASGSSLPYGTYLGGTGNDLASGLALTSSGAVVVGYTASSNFPTANPYQGTHGGGTNDIFVTEVTTSGLPFSTFLGGTGNDEGSSVTVDTGGNIYLIGTSSGSFPVRDAFQATHGGNSDIVVARLSPAGGVEWASYHGSTGNDAGPAGIAVDGFGNVWLTGSTTSTTLPTVGSPAQGTHGGGTDDAFVARIGKTPPPPALLPSTGGPLSTGPSGNATSPTTCHPVRYFDGVASLAYSDLSSDGFGTPWSQSRTWSNGAGYTSGIRNGNGWVTSDQPTLLQLSATTMAVVTSATAAHYFDYSGGVWTERFFGQNKLTENTGAGTFTIATTAGELLTFNSFGASVIAARRGKLKSYTDAGGDLTEVTSWTSDGQPAEVRRTSGSLIESWQYTYLSSGVNTGLLSSVLLRRSTDSGSTWGTVRSVAYSYYDGTQSYGNAGDLKTATIKDSSSNDIGTYYYRYYTSSSSTGYQGGLQFAFGPESYARLKNDLGATDPTAAIDSQVDDYADNYFEYDSQKRVTKEIVQGAGCSACSAGMGSYTYSYTTSGNTLGYNSWAVKTVETLPDSNTNTIYTNAYGQVMLRVYRDVGTSQNWIQFYQYDSAGRVILEANPSAISGYNDTYADLLNNQSGNYQYLRDGEGVIAKHLYASSTTANSTTAGDVTGYQKELSIQRGETGTAIKQAAWQYFTLTAGGGTINPIANETVYRNDNGTGGQTTSYAYTYFSGRAQIESVTVTSPTVTTAQNGPNSPDTATVVYDANGRAVWAKDAGGFIYYTQYDEATGSAVKTIQDVNTTLTSTFSGLPSGWTTPTGGGLHLTTTSEVDSLGRTTKLTDANTNVTYTTYDDVGHAARVYQGWDSTVPTGPTLVYREDWSRGYTEMLTMSAAPTVSSSRPTGTESVSSVQTLTRASKNTAQQVTQVDRYFDLTGLTYSASTSLGTVDVNFYRTQIGYSQRGWQNRVVSATGTIYRIVYDGLGRVASEWVGVNDTPTTGFWSVTNAAGMKQVTGYEYDGGGVGDSNLTKSIAYPGSSSALARETRTWYDWRNRAVATKLGVIASETDGALRPIYFVTYDNLGQVTQSDHYEGDGITVTDSNSDGVPDAPTSSKLRSRQTAEYDEQGRMFRSRTFSVNPSSGAVSTNSLATDIWYDRRGNVAKVSSPGGLVSKMSYDGVGRETFAYTTDGGSDSSWADALTVTGDAVLEQAETIYDSVGNVIQSTVRQRFHDETGTGALGTASSGVKARVSSVGAWYDKANRLTAMVDVGTNGGSAWTRPGSVPTRSNTERVTSRTYNAAGWVEATTDPMGRVAKTTYDAAGRVVKTITNFVDGTPSDTDDKTTEFTYNGNDQILTLTVRLPSSTQQQTQYVYGVRISDNTGTIDSNDMLKTVKHPDPSTGAASTSEQESYTRNALGQVLTYTDRNGSTHSYGYDHLGRLISDAITTLGSNVDGTVRRIRYQYDGQGNAWLISSQDNAAGGTVLNAVRREFNGLGQLKVEYQAHTGSVNPATTPSVQYAWSEMASGANHSRLTSMTYPNGRVLTQNYASGLNSNISRLTSISDTSGTLEDYTYLGLNQVVRRGHPLPEIDMTYVKLTGESNGDAGDQYTGLDRFGRVIDQRWRDTVTSATTDRFQYGYDRNGNRLYRDNLVNTAFGELYTYDGLNQLATFQRGTLNGTKTGLTGSASRSQSWDHDAVGNFESVTTDGTAQSRTHNKQNEVTGVGSATLTFDANGNTTKDETGRQFKYDAWNRLVEVKDASNNVLATFGYDGLGRRITETRSGTTTDLYYSAEWQILEERVGSAVKVQNVWSPVYVDALVLRDRDTDGNGSLDERLWVQQDANWNVTALVDNSGTVVERFVYDPFGVAAVYDASYSVRSGGSAYAWVHLHQGGKWDSAAGLYEFGQRVYSPTLMRWMQVDPIRFHAGDANLYRALSNLPTGLVDPSGLQPPPSGLPSGAIRMPTGGYGGGGYIAGSSLPFQTPTAPTTPRGGYGGGGYIAGSNATIQTATAPTTPPRLQGGGGGGPPYPPTWEEIGTGVLDWVQGAADIGGIFDPTPITDVSNASVYALRGKWDDAGLTILGVLPLLGDAGKAFKLGKAGTKATKAAGHCATETLQTGAYVTRYDPKFPGRPDPRYSIDSTTFKAGEATAKGGIRNAGEFWTQWMKLYPDSLSANNRFLIENYNTFKVSPKIDDTWLKAFPEHAGHKGETIIHHHVDFGRYAIPVPATTHVGSGGPWHAK